MALCSDSSTRKKIIMTSCTILVLLIIAGVVAAVLTRTHHQQQSGHGFYTAAVFEHARWGRMEDAPAVIVKTNLDFYRRATEIAKSKGADIIVFPEYGIFFPGNRTQLKAFLENCPDPKKSHVNPCEDASFEHKPILRALSCMAKNNSMFIVANTGDIQNCTGDHDCPTDGVFHYNTNVVFDRNGTLVVRYHKEHLFFEEGMDLPKQEQDTTFKTDFGVFGTYVCFDIDFGRMSRVAHSVEGIAFTTMWVDQPPHMISIQMWESWSLANNSTLLASNIQIPGFSAVGSGLFHDRDGPLGYTFNPDGISKLVVADVPRKGAPALPPRTSITAINNTDSWNYTHDGKDVPDQCSEKVLGPAKNIYKDYRCVEENITDYFFTKLETPKGQVESCQNGFCCRLDYATEDGLHDRFFLGAFNGMYDHFGRYSWCQKDCILVSCKALSNQRCATFSSRSNTSFSLAYLQANFTDEVVYPSVLETGTRLVPREEWSFGKESPNEWSVHFRKSSGRKLVSVGLRGRCYNRDPPYQH